MSHSLSSNVSSNLYYFGSAAAEVSLVATRGFVVVKTMTSQADRLCFVSVNGKNVFQDNRVKLRLVTFVYVYFINMTKKTTSKCLI